MAPGVLTMKGEKSSQFHHRLNSNGTVDSVCLRCFLTAAKADIGSDLQELEAAHAALVDAFVPDVPPCRASAAERPVATKSLQLEGILARPSALIVLRFFAALSGTVCPVRSARAFSRPLIAASIFCTIASGSMTNELDSGPEPA
jgi:hypothetical protein